MLFNSLEFAVFFVLVFGLYLILDHERQNWLLLVASCYFYGAWDWRFLILLLVTASVDFFCGRQIAATSDGQKKKFYLILSVGSNLAVLGFFKYFNFFTGNFSRLASVFGWHPGFVMLRIILPVGISFYTFQAMSYAIDIYRGQLTPAKSLRDFILYVVFFPQLVAGPIERAKHLLPQVSSPRILSWSQFYEGSYLIFWGLFQKMFVADNLARVVDRVFGAPAPYSGVKVFVALYAFAFQLYGDFAGYSNIARGLGRCLGFDIMVNFNLPFFSRNPQEFWRRWHISLSSFLRDYLYEPLRKIGGRLGNLWSAMVVMLLGGLWHGARWTYVAWGLYHGCLIVLYRLIQKPKLENNRKSFGAFIFFNLFCLGLIFFRSSSFGQANQMLKGLFFDVQSWADPTGLFFLLSRTLFYASPLFLVELFQWRRQDLLAIYHHRSVFVRSVFYFLCFYLWLLFGVDGAKAFIYFQF